MTRAEKRGENRGPSPFANFQKQGCVCYDGVSSKINFVLLSSRTLLEKPVGMEQIYSNKAKYIHVYIIACVGFVLRLGLN